MSFPIAATKFNLAQPHFHLQNTYFINKVVQISCLKNMHPFLSVVEKLIIALLQHYITVDYKLLQE